MVAFLVGRWSVSTTAPVPVVVAEESVAAAVAPPPALTEPAEVQAPGWVERAPTVDEVTSFLKSLRGLDRLRAKLALQAVFRGRENEIPQLLEGKWGDRSRATELTDGFAEAFELTASERQRLERALVDALSATDRLALERVQSHVVDDGRELVIEVPAFPEAGAQVYDQVSSVFTEVLGPERLGLFNEVYGSRMENLYRGIGTKTQTIRVIFNAEIREGAPPLHEVVRELGQEYGTNTVKSGSSRWGQVLEWVAPFGYLLPAEPPAPVVVAPTLPTDG